MSELMPAHHVHAADGQVSAHPDQPAADAVPAAAFAGSGGAAPSFTDQASPENAPKLSDDSASVPAVSKPELEGKLGSVGSYSVDLKADGTVTASLTIDAAGYLISLAEKSSNKVVKFVADKLVALRKK